MECIVYFDVVYGHDVKELRGLIFLDRGQLPTQSDFLLMFEEMGYKLRMESEDQLLFKPTEAGAKYSHIRIRRLDTGEQSYKEDTELKSVITNLLPRESRPI
ncbi:hypothetical protein D3C78_1664760 [compost metagenome]